jgi:hypothetical protein
MADRKSRAADGKNAAYWRGPVTAAQSKAGGRASQGNAELMAKDQVLNFKPAPRLEQVDNEHCKRAQDRNHGPDHATILPHDAKPGRIDFSEGTRIPIALTRDLKTCP